MNTSDAFTLTFAYRPAMLKRFALCLLVIAVGDDADAPKSRAEKDAALMAMLDECIKEDREERERQPRR
jgi:hypothetical protein